MGFNVVTNDVMLRDINKSFLHNDNTQTVENKLIDLLIFHFSR